MNNWELVDCLEPLQLNAENPRIPIESEARLREELARLKKRKHGYMGLNSPELDGLSFSIGGPLASFGWFPAPADRRKKGQIEAVVDHPFSSQAVDCWGEGIPVPVDPDHLFPVDQVVEAVVYFFKKHRLPEWISYREWNPATKEWEMKPSSNKPRQATAS